ncbi:hypothetical protein [Sphingobium cupriresistens]|uniref:Uncharacterized protein n=1 Tax=Sphingobium cupriresistens TaxID=1132417 RepID=A0A8G2DX97_9SPHN|nr:hypothetical protein [Sphingobium cupriresistens]RYM09227.1 hypothetical protein EWH12_14795 [Sphingobium cupriresistens]
MGYRQRIADAAVADVRYQLDPQYVGQEGTSVQIEGSFRISRVAEAIIKAALIPEELIIEEVAKAITPSGHAWEGYREPAVDAIAAVRGAILTLLDPLP